MRLEGSTVIVTGAGSGIGRALSVELARAGAELMLVGRRRDVLEETRNLFPPGPDAEIVTADLTLGADRVRVRDRAMAAFSGLDLLVNNAGIMDAATFAATSDGMMERMLATNLMAPFALTRELLPLLQAGGAPRIVNMGSLLGDIAMPNFAGYAATKFALRGLSDALRRELKPMGIGVTYVAPRATRTEGLDQIAHFVDTKGTKLDDPQLLARRIVGAIERGRRYLYPSGAERLFLLVQRFAPALIDRSVSTRTQEPQGQSPIPQISSR